MAIDILILAGSIFVLLLISALLSGSETAITATSKARMMRLAQQGAKRAKTVVYLLEQKERLIAAILLGNNLVNILASVLATSLFLELFGSTGLAYATLMMTILVVIFAEVLPKTYSILSPDRSALRVGFLLRGLLFILTPFTAVLQFISRAILRLMGTKSKHNEGLLAAHEEIRSLLDLHHQQGEVVKHDRDMLGGILDLRDIEVGEVMVHRKNLYMINIEQRAEDIIKEVLAANYTRIPLWQGNQENIIGILHAKDVLHAMAQHQNIEMIDFALLATPPWFVPETTLLADQLHAFRDKKAHFALVVDEYGALMGVVTMEDILEEIVGQIDDEHDEDAEMLKHLDNGEIMVQGQMSIRDVNREMGWTLPDEMATTIAGLVIYEAQIIPKEGQQFDYFGLRFTVASRQRNQITALRIMPLV